MGMETTPFRDDPRAGLERIRSTVRRYARDAGELDEISQECCVRILTKERLWSDRGIPFLHWVSVVARRTALTFRRGEDRRARREVPLGPVDPGAEADAEKALSAAQVQRIMERFARLSGRQRTILQMKYFQDRRTSDIAVELGMTPSAVSHEAARALERLRRSGLGAWWGGVLLPWVWSGREASAASGASLGGIVTMKGKAVAAVAVVGVLGTSVLGYRCREMSFALEDREKRLARLEDETTRLKESLATAREKPVQDRLSVGAAQAVLEKEGSGGTGTPPAAPIETRRGRRNEFLELALQGVRAMRSPERREETRRLMRPQFKARQKSLFDEWGLDDPAREAVVDAYFDHFFREAELKEVLVLDETVSEEDVRQRLDESYTAFERTVAPYVGSQGVASFWAYQDERDWKEREKMIDETLSRLEVDPSALPPLREILLRAEKEDEVWMARNAGLVAGRGLRTMSVEDLRAIRVAELETPPERILALLAERQADVLERARPYLTPRQLEDLRGQQEIRTMLVKMALAARAGMDAK